MAKYLDPKSNPLPLILPRQAFGACIDEVLPDDERVERALEFVPSTVPRGPPAALLFGTPGLLAPVRPQQQQRQQYQQEQWQEQQQQQQQQPWQQQQQWQQQQPWQPWQQQQQQQQQYPRQNGGAGPGPSATEQQAVFAADDGSQMWSECPICCLSHPRMICCVDGCGRHCYNFFIGPARAAHFRCSAHESYLFQH